MATEVNTVALFESNAQPKANQQQPVAEKAQSPSQTPNFDKLPAEVKSQAKEAGKPIHQLMETATKHRPEFQHTPNDAHNAPDGGKGALMHTQSAGKEKAQESLSPTDSSKGNTQQQSQQRTPQRGREIER